MLLYQVDSHFLQLCTWVIAQVYIGPLKQKNPYWSAHPLQAQAHAHHLKDPIGRCLCGGIQKWYSSQVFWWSHQAHTIFTHIHLLCWLPWKVGWIYRMYVSHWHIGPRILLVSIHDKGICPCPQCLILKSTFHQLGFLNDVSARISSIQLPFIQKILDTWWAIYFLGKPLKSALVEYILKPLFLVLTVVSHFQSAILISTTILNYVECLHKVYSMASIYSAHSWSIYSMSLARSSKVSPQTSCQNTPHNRPISCPYSTRGVYIRSYVSLQRTDATPSL